MWLYSDFNNVAFAFSKENGCVTCSVSAVLPRNKWFYFLPPDGVKLKWMPHVDCGQLTGCIYKCCAFSVEHRSELVLS